jgi:hypothetical protein
MEADLNNNMITIFLPSPFFCLLENEYIKSAFGIGSVFHASWI